ncbi:hypothetical protein ACFOY2_05495 [Nonomuraea purpurea]|uniref:Uncharacterized protein n=1 Tax=Nonomuraea purpurea TaxID=1849276 RepID=A0ABV8FY24_9ACTN
MGNLPQVLCDIRARRNAEVTFGYVMQDGTFVWVRGIVLSYYGTEERGITGVRVRYTGPVNPHFFKWQDSSGHAVVPFNVAGIEKGEAIRAERECEKRRTERAAYRAANPATDKQIRFLQDLHAKAGRQAPADLDQISKAEASELIGALEDELHPIQARRGCCQSCGGPLNPHGDLDGLRGVRGLCYDCI